MLRLPGHDLVADPVNSKDAPLSLVACRIHSFCTPHAAVEVVLQLSELRLGTAAVSKFRTAVATQRSRPQRHNESRPNDLLVVRADASRRRSKTVLPRERMLARRENLGKGASGKLGLSSGKRHLGPPSSRNSSSRFLISPHVPPSSLPGFPSARTGEPSKALCTG